MKKKFLFFGSIMLSAIAFAQNEKVGIGTNTPQQVLHIDPSKNTQGTTNTSDDIVVTAAGNVGIGTIAPTSKLEIVSTTPKAIKIVDGTQGDLKLLMSDANGVGSWVLPNSSKPLVLGEFPSPAVLSVGSTGGGVKNANVRILLTPGKWMVNFGGTFKMGTDVSGPFWLHVYLSSSTTARENTNFDFVGSAGNNSAYAGLMVKNVIPLVGNANFISGSTIIDVKNNNPIYVVVENVFSTTAGQVKNWNYFTGNWENYFYAVPLN